VGVLERRLFFFAVIGTPDCPATSLVSIKTTLPHNIIVRPIAEHCWEGDLSCYAIAHGIPIKTDQNYTSILPAYCIQDVFECHCYLVRSFLCVFLDITSSSNCYRGADKSLPRPGRKQAKAIKLTFASHSKKNSDVCPSVQPDLRGRNDLRVGRKMATFQLFFQTGRAEDLSAPL